MPANQQRPEQTASEKQEQPQLNSLIGDRVLLALGLPGNLHRVQVRRLWGDRYRVNVLVGEEVGSTRIAHSFFLVADRDGNIVESTPALTRQRP
jgi:hypothetical protein